MSFNDLERGVPLRTQSHSASASDVQAFDKLKEAVSMQIFKINANVKGIQTLLAKLDADRGAARGPRDTLSNLLDATRDIVKNSTTSVKTLLAFPFPASEPQRKAVQLKLSREYSSALEGFQRIQRVAAEKQRTVVESKKRVVQEEREEESAHLLELEEQGGQMSQQQIQQQQQEQAIPAHELEFQEAQIQERETEIRQIETGIHELNEIFRDLSTLVVEQGGMIDNIESNITSVATHTAGAAEELTTAHEYQRKAGRRMAWLMFILLIVVGIVLLAVLS